MALVAGVAEAARERLRRPGVSVYARRRAVAGAVLIGVAVVIALAVSKGSSVTSLAVGGSKSDVQEKAGERMSRLAGRIAAPWVDRRSELGLFVDPITGGAGHGYGPAMLAEALIRAGDRLENRRLLRAGLRALSVERRPRGRRRQARQPARALRDRVGLWLGGQQPGRRPRLEARGS